MFLYINLACYWLEAFSDLLPQIESSIFVESYMYVALLTVKDRTVWGNAFAPLCYVPVNIALCNLLWCQAYWQLIDRIGNISRVAKPW